MLVMMLKLLQLYAPEIWLMSLLSPCMYSLVAALTDSVQSHTLVLYLE